MSDNSQPARGFIAELRRRNVFRVAVFYLVISWFTLQVSDIVFPALALPTWTITLVLVLLMLGFPIAVLFAWIFELTPEGLKRQEEVDRSQSITHTTGRKLDFMIIGVLAIALVVLLVDRFFPDQSISPEVEAEKTIAVLPFVNMNGDAETSAFSDGLAETLLHMLAQIEGLHVAARTSSFYFRDHTGDVAAIADQLHVRNLLEGSVQRSGNQISVTAQLIDASNGFHLWSGNYKRHDLANVFAIQEEIASQVVKKLRLTLLGTAAELDEGGTHNVHAYEAFLQGRLAKSDFSFESLPRAERYFAEAIRLDPAYGRAYLELVETYLNMSQIGVIETAEAQNKARPVLSRVRELLGDTAEVLAVVGHFEAGNIWLNGESAQLAAEAAFLAALEKDPENIKALNNYAWFLQATLQRPAEAAQYAARGLSHDPRSESLLTVYGSALRRLGRTDEALEQFAKLREYYPKSPAGYYFAANVFWETGNLADAVKWSRAAARVDPADHEIPAQVARLLIDVGDLDAVMPWIERSFQIDADSSVAKAALLDFYAIKGQREKGLALAREVLAQGASVRGGARWVSLWWLLDEGFRTGDFDEFMGAMRSHYADLFATPPQLHAANEGYASLLFRAYYAMGQTAKADQLLQLLLRLFADQAKQDPDSNLDDEIIIYATLGRDDDALQGLATKEKQKEFGVFWAFDLDPGIESLHNTEQYQAIQRRVRTYMASQREQIRASGDHLVPLAD